MRFDTMTPTKNGEPLADASAPADLAGMQVWNVAPTPHGLCAYYG